MMTWDAWKRQSPSTASQRIFMSRCATSMAKGEPATTSPIPSSHCTVMTKPARSCTGLLNAIESFGHAAEPWTAWALLHDLEQATGNTQAAADAWRQAVQSYLAYRRDGGENQDAWGATVCPDRTRYPAGRDDRGRTIPGPGCGGSRYSTSAQGHDFQAASHPQRRP